MAHLLFVFSVRREVTYLFQYGLQVSLDGQGTLNVVMQFTGIGFNLEVWMSSKREEASVVLLE